MSELSEAVGPNVHPDAFVAPNATVIGHVVVEREANIWYGCVLRADIEPITIGEQTCIQDLTVIHVDSGFPTTVGPRVGVGHKCLLHGCVVEESCLIGMGSIVLSGAVIETGSIVAAGSLVTEGTRVPAGCLVMGTPAKVVRKVDDVLRARIEHTWRDYVELARGHRAGRYQGPGRDSAGS